MKQVVLEFDDEEMELLEEQFKQIQDVAGMETIEDYIYYATMSHCKTMQAASKMFGQSGDIEKLMAEVTAEQRVLAAEAMLALGADESAIVKVIAEKFQVSEDEAKATVTKAHKN